MIWVMFVGFLKSLWDRFAFYIVAVGSLFLAILVAFIKGKAEGREKLKKQLQKADEKAAIKTEKIKRSVEKASDADINRRLDRWYRD